MTGPIGSFTDPEYAQVGLTEAQARDRSSTSATAPFDSAARPIIDGRAVGFCKLIVAREHQILGCHIVGERAVDIVQIAAVTIGRACRARAGEEPFHPHHADPRGVAVGPSSS